MAAMGFRAFHVVVIEVARQAMAENGGKWQKMVENGLPRVSCYGHRGEQVDNGRKWPKMVEKWSKKVHRGYLVENGFSRIIRLFSTTGIIIRQLIL